MYTLQAFTGISCPAIFSKTPEDFTRCAKFAFAHPFCGTAAEAPASSSESLYALAKPPFDEFLIPSKHQLTCGVPGIDQPTKNGRTRLFRTLPKTKCGGTSARKEPICQPSPGRRCPPSSFPLLLSVCLIPARSPSGSAFPSIPYLGKAARAFSDAAIISPRGRRDGLI